MYILSPLTNRYIKMVIDSNVENKLKTQAKIFYKQSIQLFAIYHLCKITVKEYQPYLSKNKSSYIDYESMIANTIEYFLQFKNDFVTKSLQETKQIMKLKLLEFMHLHIKTYYKNPILSRELNLIWS